MNNEIQKPWSFNMPSGEEMGHLIRFCDVMAKAPFYAKLGAPGILAIYLTAREHNLPFMASLNGGLHTYDGKVTFSAQMISALIINAGHTADVISLDERHCRILFTRGDRKNDPNYKPFLFTYTIDQAQKAGYLSKNNWKTSPTDMLWCRCLTGGARKHLGEIMVGILVAGELVGTEIDGNVIVDAPSTSLLPKLEEHIKTEDPPKIDFVKGEGFDEFIIKHGLITYPDGSINPKMKYIVETCQKCNKTVNELINLAILNESQFELKFDSWYKKNYKKSEKMDNQETAS